MDWVNLFYATILGIVEGLTEFLPVSSTGHLIVVSDFLGFGKSASADTFVIAIQTGAILAVCWYYRDRILSILTGLKHDNQQQRLVINTLVAFFPAAVMGFLIAGFLKQYLFNPVSVATALILGGVLILCVEHWNLKHKAKPRVREMDDMTWLDALKVGCAQCFAMIPGTSRSGATIIGGLLVGLSRKAATEFSFFLSIPTILGATTYELWRSHDLLVMDNAPAFLVGTVVSFLSALIVVHWLIRFVSSHDFRVFGWYRIIFGTIILVSWQTGLISWA